MIAFSPVVAEATSLAYKGAPAEIQAKLRRVVDVWKDRSIFEVPIQKAIETRLEELDKARGAPRPGFGGSPFGGSSVPSELTPLVTRHQKVAKLSASLTSITASVFEEYDKQLDPENAVPSAPVYAARLNGLLKTLANAENAVAECVKAREDLVSSLEKLLDANRDALARDKRIVEDLRGRKTNIEDKKQQVEVAIMRALGPLESNGTSREGDLGSPGPEPDRPEMEALTPPSMQEDPLTGEALQSTEDTEVVVASSTIAVMTQDIPSPAYQTLPVSDNGSNKRRRIEHPGDFPDLAGDDGIDAEVTQMLKEEVDV